jgi:hypothetical protein
VKKNGEEIWSVEAKQESEKKQIKAASPTPTFISKRVVIFSIWEQVEKKNIMNHSGIAEQTRASLIGWAATQIAFAKQTNNNWGMQTQRKEKENQQNRYAMCQMRCTSCCLHQFRSKQLALKEKKKPTCDNKQSSANRPRRKMKKKRINVHKSHLCGVASQGQVRLKRLLTDINHVANCQNDVVAIKISSRERVESREPKKVWKRRQQTGIDNLFSYSKE